GYSNIADIVISNCPVLISPHELTGNAVSATRIDLNWADDSNDETAFHVERSLDGNAWTEIHVVDANVTDYSNTDLSCETTYFYRVRAFRSINNEFSSYSPVLEIETLSCSLLAPSELIAQPVSATSINLTWIDNTIDEATFSIERSLDGVIWTEIGMVTADVTTFSDNDLDCNIFYHYRVHAYRDVISEYTPYSNITGTKPLPCAPTQLVASQTVDYVELNWVDHSSDETVFLIERTLLGVSGWEQISSVDANTTTYRDQTAGCETSLVYRVRAYRADDDRYSAYSNLLDLTTLPCTPQPGPVLNVTKTIDTNDGQCSVNDCSLREAVIAANNWPSTNTINLPVGTYILDIAGRGEDFSATGDLDIRGELVIVGTGASETIIDGAHLDRIFHIAVPVNVHISAVTIRNGESSDQGGGILSENGARLTVSNSRFIDNTTNQRGGAIMTYHNYNVDGLVLTVEDSVFVNNSAQTCGAIGTNIYRSSIRLIITGSTFTGNSAGTYGGAICNANTMYIDNSTISNNTSGRNGGGIGTTDLSLFITNSTISGNSAAEDGGGIIGGSRVSLKFVTLIDNIADSDQNGVGMGGGIYAYFGQPRLYNTILYGNKNGNGEASDCYDILNSEDYNLIGSTANCLVLGQIEHNIYDVDPMLGPLQDNGGSTLTHAPQPESPVIDTGDPNCEINDQRGLNRPQGVACDIGSYEVAETILPIVEQIDTIPNTGDNNLVEGELTEVAITHFLISFNKPMFDPAGSDDPADVTLAENYQLFKANDDNVQTTACGAPSGDDVAISVTDVSYAAETHTATLTVNQGVELGSGIYRLLICGSIKDQEGELLSTSIDGDYIRNFTITSYTPVTDLKINQSLSSALVIPGENLTYSLFVGNDGVDPATNIVVTNVFPPGMTFISASAEKGSCAEQGDRVICNLDTLEIGEFITIDLTVFVNPDVRDMVTNTATVTAAEYDSDLANNTTIGTAAVILPQIPGPTTLLAPIEGQLIEDSSSTFNWHAVANGSRYQLQIDNDSQFDSPEVDVMVSGL
ncbi:MAG: DUF11 domain-containing protein, partial [Anaerolineae bacterium]|nr:DUF11 domain-containing protein [Anaerolineae bacterium]